MSWLVFFQKVHAKKKGFKKFLAKSFSTKKNILKNNAYRNHNKKIKK